MLEKKAVSKIKSIVNFLMYQKGPLLPIFLTCKKQINQPLRAKPVSQQSSSARKKCQPTPTKTTLKTDIPTEEKTINHTP
ncbi:MAG: hypothetical protein R6U21_05210 [Thermoplasmatota archaeon]